MSEVLLETKRIQLKLFRNRPFPYFVFPLTELIACFLLFYCYLFIYCYACSIRDITKEVAAAVIKEAIEEDLAEGYREIDGRELRKLNQVFPSLLSSRKFDFT